MVVKGILTADTETGIRTAGLVILETVAVGLRALVGLAVALGLLLKEELLVSGMGV